MLNSSFTLVSEKQAIPQRRVTIRYIGTVLGRVAQPFAIVQLSRVTV